MLDISIVMRERLACGALGEEIRVTLDVSKKSADVMVANGILGSFPWDERRGRFKGFLPLAEEGFTSGAGLQDALEEAIRKALRAGQVAISKTTRRSRRVKHGMHEILVGKLAWAGGAWGDLEVPSSLAHSALNEPPASKETKALATPKERLSFGPSFLSSPEFLKRARASWADN